MKFFVSGFLLVILVLTSPVLGQLEKQKKKPKKQTDPFTQPFANPVDDPKLQRVLIVGDSISIGYTPRVRRLLKGQANVHRPQTNCRWSAFGDENIESWMGDSKWDAVHFNFGLWDWYGWSQEEKATPESYARSLDSIVSKLKSKTNAKLIFGVTTPPCAGQEKKAKIVVTEEQARAFNAAAIEVMKKHGVAINDLYATIGNQRAKYQRGENDVHYTPEGQELLATQVAKTLKHALRTKKAPVVEKHIFPDEVTSEVYKTASNSELSIYRFDPQGYAPAQDKRPAAVFFFGGGWNGGTVTQFEQQAKYLASRGMVTFVADYRVKSRQKTAPDACVADGKSAIRWVRTHAARLGVDPNRIAAGGGSAGGHVAAASGICDGLDEDTEKDSEISSKPNALLLFNPVYDNGPQGYGHGRVKKWFPAISPAHNISADDPPTIVFLGDSDKLIPVDTAKKFDADLKAMGVKSEVWIYKDQSHGFFNENKSQESFLDTVRKMDTFLVSLGWLEGAVDEEALSSVLAPKKNRPAKKAKK